MPPARAGAAEDDVLAYMVHVQSCENQLAVATHGAGPGGVPGPGAADQCRDGRELPAEHPVDHDHLVNVGLLIGDGRSAHGATSVSESVSACVDDLSPECARARFVTTHSTSTTPPQLLRALPLNRTASCVRFGCLAAGGSGSAGPAGGIPRARRAVPVDADGGGVVKEPCPRSPTGRCGRVPGRSGEDADRPLWPESARYRR